MVVCFHLRIHTCFYIRMCLRPTSGRVLFLTPSGRMQHPVVITPSVPAPQLGNHVGTAAAAESDRTVECDQYSSPLPSWSRTSPGPQHDPRKPGVFTGGCLPIAIAHISLSEFMRMFNTTKARVPVHKIDYNLSVWEGQCSWCSTSSVLAHKHCTGLRTRVTDSKACLYSSFQK